MQPTERSKTFLDQVYNILEPKTRKKTVEKTNEKIAALCTSPATDNLKKLIDEEPNWSR